MTYKRAALLVLMLLFIGCSNQGQPSKEEAVKQATAFIEQYKWQHLLWEQRKLSDWVHLRAIWVIDTRKIDPSTVEVIYDAQFDVLQDVHSTQLDPIAFLVGTDSLKKGVQRNISGISFLFRRFEKRGWVLAR